MSSHDCSRPMRGWVRGSLTATAIELCFLIGLLATVHSVSAGGAVVVMVWMFAFAPLVRLVTCALSALPALLVRVSRDREQGFHPHREQGFQRIVSSDFRRS